MHLPMTRWIGAANVVPIFCVVAIVGAALWSLVAPFPQISELDVGLGRAKIEGVVARDPDIREQTIRLIVSVEKLNETALLQEARVLVSADRFTEVSYGDRIIVNGLLKKPESFETDSGRTFQYPYYLLAHGITHEISFAEVSVTEHGEGNPIVASLLSVKHLLRAGIHRALPEPESALLAGLLLGEKQSLGKKVTEAFRNAGVVHIIVLSGYNVALVIQAVTLITLRVFSRGWAYGVAAVFVLGFAVMTGLSETTLRATIMALLMMLATVLHRPKAALRGLLVAAALMALWSPYVVLYDLSFQLSVLATLGLVLFSDRLAKHLSFIPETLALRDITATTLSTQITVLPLLIFSVGQVSLLFLPANILVLPAVPVAMLIGFFAALISLLSTAVAFPLSAISYGILTYIIHVSVWLGSLSFASLVIPAGWMWPILGTLCALYALGFFFFKRKTLI